MTNIKELNQIENTFNKIHKKLVKGFSNLSPNSKSIITNWKYKTGGGGTCYRPQYDWNCGTHFESILGRF